MHITEFISFVPRLRDTEKKFNRVNIVGEKLTSIVILTYILKPKYNVEKVVKFDLIKACHWCSYRCFNVIFAYRYGQASSTGQSLLPLGSTAKLSSLKPPQYCPEQEIPNVMSKIQQLGISVVNSKTRN